MLFGVSGLLLLLLWQAGRYQHNTPRRGPPLLPPADSRSVTLLPPICSTATASPPSLLSPILAPILAPSHLLPPPSQEGTPFSMPHAGSAPDLTAAPDSFASKNDEPLARSQTCAESKLDLVGQVDSIVGKIEMINLVVQV